MKNYTEMAPEVFTSEELSQIDESVLSNRQVLHIFWSSTCMTANIILMFILKKKARESFYLTMSYWCISNFIYMGIWLYFGIIPELCTNYQTERFIHILGIMFIHVSEIHAVMILSNNIMSSIKRCQCIIYGMWFIVFSCVAIFVRRALFVDTDNYFKLTLTGAINIASLMVLSSKIFIKQSKPNNDLNVALTSITVVSTFFLWLSEIVYLYFKLNNIVILDTFIVILYGASIANLVLFVCYDDDTKRYIFQKLKKLVQASLITAKCKDNTVGSEKEETPIYIKTDV